MYRQEEADRSALRERWVGGLPGKDKETLEALCLAIAGPVVRACLPPDLPTCIHGSMARLAIEYGAFCRRDAAERREREASLVDRGLGNRSVRNSVLSGFVKEAAEAASRLIGRWFRELTPEQAASFDGSRVNQVEDAARPPTEAKSAPPRDHPVWDLTARCLRFRGEVCKQYRRPAKDQEKILAAFHEEGWPDAIDDPLPPGKLPTTVESLNDRLEHIKFHLNGATTGVCWRPA